MFALTSWLYSTRILLSKDKLTTLFVEEIKLNIREVSLLETMARCSVKGHRGDSQNILHIYSLLAWEAYRIGWLEA